LSILRAFGQRKLQPLIIRLASNRVFRSVSDELLPLITLEDCLSCPLLEHCAKACLGFRNLCIKAGVVNG